MDRAPLRCWNWLLLVALALPGSGCRWYSGVWYKPFSDVERTTFLTPAKRIAAIEEIGGRATGQDTPDQQQAVNELARQIQTERDPLVREAIVKAAGGFNTPLSEQMLTAGLKDSDNGVRRRACESLGQRAKPALVPVLEGVARSDGDFDVRVAAVKALGGIKTPESAKALLVALEDRDPAMQFVGVEAMRNVTGRDLGGDVRAYVAMARDGTPPKQEPTSMATKVKEWNPFR